MRSVKGMARVKEAIAAIDVMTTQIKDLEEIVKEDRKEFMPLWKGCGRYALQLTNAAE